MRGKRSRNAVGALVQVQMCIVRFLYLYDLTPFDSSVESLYRTDESFVRSTCIRPFSTCVPFVLLFYPVPVDAKGNYYCTQVARTTKSYCTQNS